ncbi:MAG: succinate dehydrogenase cytochrome b subunit [Cyanobacteria bacterium J06614_10]
MVLTPSSSQQKGDASVDVPASSGFLSSSIGKKLLTGVTGLTLFLFVVVHLVGNLMLFVSPTVYNQLAQRIESLGPVLAVIELLLLAAVSVHAVTAINIYLGKRQARSVAYTHYASAGEPSRQTLAARTMIFSGLLLGGFLVFHLATFKFGTVYRLPGSGDRDLARLVFETFRKPGYTAGYVVVLSLLGLHLRHGIWSALQSLGVETKPGLFAASAVIGGAIALGFIGLPLAIYFGFIG